MERRFISRCLSFGMAAALLIGAVAPVSAATWTDQPDYSPGSVVTISGDDSDGAGYLAGETVHVDVSGPNGYSSSCDATADASGAWSCQVTLNADGTAVGNYAYSATGQTSGVTQTGTFTDAINVSITSSALGWLTASPASIVLSGKYTCSSGGTACTGASLVIEVHDSDGVNNTAGGTLRHTSSATALGSGTNQNWSKTITPPALGDRQYDLKAILTVTSGTGTGSTTTFVFDNYFGVDTASPTVTVATAAPDPSNHITATGTASDATSGIPNGGVNVKLNSDDTVNDLSCAGTLTQLATAGENPGSWSHSFGGAVGTAQGDYCVTAQATDNAGNPSAVASRYYHITDIAGTSPADLATNVAPSANVVVTFSDPVNVSTSPSWITVTCNGTPHAGSTSGGGTSVITFDPTTNFTVGDHCVVTVVRNRVTPTGTQYYILGSSYQFSFDVANPDLTSPTNVSISIDGGATWTNTTAATLHIHGEDNVGVTGYFVKNGTSADCLAEPLGSYTAVGSTTSYDDAALAHTLSSGDGTKTVCVVFRDAAGNTAAAQDTIGLDTAAPMITKSITGTPTYNDGTNDFVTSATTLRVNVAESGSGLSGCTISIDGPSTNDTSFDCSTGDNDFTLGGKLTTPPDGTYVISVDATDNAGNPGSDPLTVVLDDTGPDNFAETLGSPNYTDGSSNVWVTSTTDISVSGDDGTGSGVASCGLDFDAAGTPSAYTLGTDFTMPSGDGSHTYSVTCLDNLGNSSSPFAKTRYVDDTAPDNYSETIGNPKYDDGTTIWVTSATPFSVTGDDGSGVGVKDCTIDFDGAGTPAAYTLGTDFYLPSGDGSHTYSIVCEDQLGNDNNALPDAADRTVDDTGPVVTVTGVTDGATYILGSVPVAGCSTTDGSGVGVDTSASLTGPTGLDVNGVGTATGSCGGATDLLGNAQSPDPLTFTFHVIYDPAGLSGILQPINPDNTSVFKRGQAIPVKFRLSGDEFFGFVTTSWTIQAQQVACSVFDGTDTTLENVGSNTPSTYFRYDATADQYVYNADMHNKGVGTCWNFKVTLDSGQFFYSAVFKLSK